MARRYAVLGIQDTLIVMGQPVKIPNDYGIVGFLPVFKTKKDAEKYSEGKFLIVTLEADKNG